MLITKEYVAAREQAIEWLNSQTRDYNEGTAILARSGFKPVVAANLARRGDKPYTREKLEYELRQMLQVWYNPDDIIYEDVDLSDDAEPGHDGRPESLSPEQDREMLAAAESEDDRQQDEQPSYPKVIAALIYEFRDLYILREKLHRSLADMGESNQQEVVSKRQTVVNAISAISERMKFIHALRTAYEQNGTLPEREELDKAYGRTPLHEVKSESKDVAQDEDERFAAMSVEQLKKAKINAQIKVSKARNMLLYSSEKKGEVENPLPNGPARIKYERKIARQNEIIEKINYRLAELS